jgi:starch synthase
VRIAFVAPECDPLLKVGGLADVVGSLPRALRRLGHDVEIYLPRFAAIESHYLHDAIYEGSIAVRQPPLPERADLHRVAARDVPVHLVGCPELFEREPHPYGAYDDQAARYGFFALAVLEAMTREGATPDVIHLHDWPMGLLPIYRSLGFKGTALKRTGILFTIHNVAHPGVFQSPWLRFLGLPDWLDSLEQLEFHGQLSMLKGGLLWSTMVGTVSPNYAREIQGPALGCRMDGVLRKRGFDLVGVLNGIDTEVWDPARKETGPDAGDWPTFDADNLAGKDAHRAALRARLGLHQDPAAPIFGFVSRLDPQKGVGAIFGAMPRFLDAGCQLAILGDGADVYRDTFRRLAARYPGRVGGALEFNPLLAKRIYAGSDFFLMPSKFEPCGLSQMIACRYGTPPIVSLTGGLADTIRDADANENGNGFTFPAPVTMNDLEWQPAATAGLAHAIERALRAFGDRPRYVAIRRRAMRSDFSWDRSAREYEAVYAECVRREAANS